MKKTVMLILWSITLILAFVFGFYLGNADTEITNNTEVSAENEAAQAAGEDAVEISVSDAERIAKERNGLSSREAEELCAVVLGERAEENGFPISYRCISAVSVKDKLYYVMHITWRVNDSHWSYIGNCYVSADGEEIYDGIVSPGQYEMTELRWEK